MWIRRFTQFHYQGGVDDLAIYDRELTNEEIYFLYELRRGREQIPRLEAVVDAVGTVEILDAGFGYRENPKLMSLGMTKAWISKLSQSQQRP